MNQFTADELKKLYIPAKDSHKGQNGKLLIIGGSHLFHAALLWALEIASKIVDMVFYSSVPENEKIIQDAKETFRNGIVVRREFLDDYVQEADCVLIGPGMVRTDKKLRTTKYELQNLQEIYQLEDEGEQTYYLTKYLLQKYPEKKWIVDAGALQMIDPEDLLSLGGNVIITPHPVEFSRVFESRIPGAELIKELTIEKQQQIVAEAAKKYNTIILLKGEHDIVCSPDSCVIVSGGNPGMTKGGTGDILAGLTAALACNNDMFLAAKAASFLNKKAGEGLYQRVGYYFNASDLLQEIPVIMKQYLLE